LCTGVWLAMAVGATASAATVMARRVRIVGVRAQDVTPHEHTDAPLTTVYGTKNPTGLF
jgi:hypothetical protein